MPSIKRCQKVTTPHTVLSLIPPEEPGYAIEHCTLDGWTYFAVEGELPAQHAEITLEDVTLTAAKRKAIRKASHQWQSMRRMAFAKIREQVSEGDELEAIRAGNTTEVDAVVQAVRAEFQPIKDRLGL